MYTILFCEYIVLQFNIEKILTVKGGVHIAMTAREMTKQAFALYDNIRMNFSTAPLYSEQLIRLYNLQSRAFYRYKRRLKNEP